MGPEDLQVVKYIEALTLPDWAFAHKAPPTGCLFYSPIREAPDDLALTQALRADIATAQSSTRQLFALPATESGIILPPLPHQGPPRILRPCRS